MVARRVAHSDVAISSVVSVGAVVVGVVVLGGGAVVVVGAVVGDDVELDGTVVGCCASFGEDVPSEHPASATTTRATPSYSVVRLLPRREVVEAVVPPCTSRALQPSRPWRRSDCSE